jgi:hypothetical protein
VTDGLALARWSSSAARSPTSSFRGHAERAGARLEAPVPPQEIVQLFLTKPDLVLMEGYKDVRFAKIEVPFEFCASNGKL